MGVLTRPVGRSIALLLALAPVVVGACGPVAEGRAKPDVSGRRIRAVTTIGMIADVVENVGGKRVDVEGLMGPGVDPHLYKASERDVITLATADIVFYNGLHLEAKMADVFAEMRGFQPTAAVTDGIDRSLLLSPPEFQGAHDPHVWFDVRLWMNATQRVADTLVDLDPRSEPYYHDNERAYLKELGALHRYVKRRARLVPADKRVLITAHDAFNYFGRAYGFEVRGLQGISTVSEAGTADVSGLADFIAEREIPAIFVESSVPVRFVEAVREAVLARGSEIDVGGQLYSDAMGDAGTPEGTYTGMVRHNIDTIVSALSGRRSPAEGAEGTNG